jgi:hypothetical protein
MALGEGSWVPTVVSAFRINSHSMHAWFSYRTHLQKHLGL